MLQDENDTLNDQLATEEERSDGLQQGLDLAEGQIEELEAIARDLENDLRLKTREYENALAELAAMQSVTNDSTKILTEKLALAREVALLKPEVESLRDQVESNKSLLTEKLALQRQLTTVQVELENAHRSAQRAIAKAGSKNDDQSEWDLQIDDLQKKLREAKLARREAEGEVEQLKHDLDAQKRSTNKTKSKKAKQDENLVELDEELSSLKEQLENSKEETLKWREEAKKLQNSQSTESKSTEKTNAKLEETVATLKTQLDETKKEIALEKRERQKLEKALQKEQNSWEAQKDLLDEKLNQFRTKLRSTKERLKDAEEQLEQAQTAATAKPTAASKKADKAKPAGRKRAAPPDETMMGTPGDEPPAKRGKRAGPIARALPGEKSNFSITPFLNRTSMSIAPESPQEDDTKQTTEQTEQISQLDDSPTAKPAATTKTSKAVPPLKMKPLTSAASSKHNSKSIGRKLSSLPSLQEVAEESSEVISDPQPTKTINITTTFMPTTDLTIEVPTKPTAASTANPIKPSLKSTQPIPKLKPTSNKPRKSLMTFTSYTDEPVPEKRKKRKLGTGPPKTLFDEEEDVLPAKPIPGRGLFAARALKAAGAKKLGASGSLMMSTGDGFQFSPLKKERRGVGSTFLE